jgi:hypothetical protein
MPTGPFNDAQVRHVVATLRHIDEILAHAMQPATGTRAPARESRAIPPETDAAVAAMREDLHDALETWAPGEPDTSGQLRWALQTALRLAQIALAELDEKHLVHYGQVDPSGLGLLSETRERLGNGLENIRATLERA